MLALLVTFLWSTSFIIIKIGLEEIPPVIFAGLRYAAAFFVLLPFAFKKENIVIIKNLSTKDWRKLFLLGILFYTLTQGTQFIGLSLIPSVTVSLILNLTPLVVAVIAIFVLNEVPASLQRVGILLFISGVIIYFFPLQFSSDYLTGIIAMVAGVLANAFSAILGRKINKGGKIKPLIVTIISMGFGSFLLVMIGLFTQTLPELKIESLVYILWLAIINTAFAFTIWNFTLRTLSATESSIINGTMLFQIAILAWIFLGEGISIKEIAGMIIVSLGVVLVQVKMKKSFTGVRNSFDKRTQL
jgi:drug/metabolite transporter (DMT)-like permease